MKKYESPAFEEIKYSTDDVLSLSEAKRDSRILAGQKGGAEGISDLSNIDD